MTDSQEISQASQPKRRYDDHDHGNPFLVPFLLILGFSFVEFYTGLQAKSLALLGDAWHMFSDVFSLGLAMLAAYSASRVKQHAAEQQQTRFEIFASMINAVLMLVVVVWIVVEAIARYQDPHPVAGGAVMLVAFLGLIINIIVALRLQHLAEHHGGEENLNQRAALVHVIGDLLGSVAALVSGIIIHFTGWFPIDAILSIFISLLLLMVTLNLMRDIWRICKGQATHTHHHHHH